MHNFISLRPFTIYMKISQRFEISLPSNWPKRNFHRSEFHFAWSNVNADNEVNFFCLLYLSLELKYNLMHLLELSSTSYNNISENRQKKRN